MNVTELIEQLDQLRIEGYGDIEVTVLTQDDFEVFQDQIDAVIYSEGGVYVTRSDTFERMLEP